MPHLMPSSQVLVVGAGPSGLVLALALLRNEVSVRIIEKSPFPRLGQRGAGIMPRSMELFHLLGVGDQIRRLARTMPEVKLYELGAGLEPMATFELHPREEPTAAMPYPNILLLGQDALERVLHNELAKYDCHVELGTELVSFSQGSDFVDAKIMKHGILQNCRYSWLLGADGGRSTVRKQLGAKFLGETPNVNNIVVGDIKIDGLDNNFWHMWGDSSTTLISLRPTDTPSLFSFVISGEAVDHHLLSTDADSLRSFLTAKTGGVVFRELTWISTYRPNVRMVDRLGEGRVFLAGDSCHIISFTGGQSMNTGVHDSINLAWKIALVEHGHAPYRLLKTYGEERLPVARDMLEQSIALLKSEFTSQGKNAFSELRWHYRWSSLVVDEQQMVCGYFGDDDSDLRAGDRAPDAPGLVGSRTKTRLFDVFSPSHHTVLIFSDDSGLYSAVHRALTKYPRGTILPFLVLRPGQTRPKNAESILDDTCSHAYDTYAAGRCPITIVRPDGMIGGIVEDVDGLKRYFDVLFTV